MLEIHAFVTWALMGLIWHVQVVQYPLFLAIGPESFSRYHFGHCLRITFLVVPLIFLEALTAVWLIWEGERGSLFLLTLSLIGLAWFSTFFYQAPIHHRLIMEGRSDALIRRLVRTNWLRTWAWTARAFIVGWICLQ
jgi:hypothetical protein